jgi:hypothetical protein
MIIKCSRSQSSEVELEFEPVLLQSPCYNHYICVFTENSKVAIWDVVGGCCSEEQSLEHFIDSINSLKQVGTCVRVVCMCGVCVCLEAWKCYILKYTFFAILFVLQVM